MFSLALGLKSHILLLLPGKGLGSSLSVIGPAGLFMTGKNSRVPKALIKQEKTMHNLVLVLARKSFKEVVTVTTPGRLFHSRIVRGKNDL